MAEHTTSLQETRLPDVREPGRLRALAAYDVLDSGSEVVLDGLVHLAARLCEAPLAMITLVDEARQVFKARTDAQTAADTSQTDTSQTGASQAGASQAGASQTGASPVGAPPSAASLEVGFCPIVVERTEPLVVPDTLADPLHARNPVTRDDGIRFYAGVPLLTRERHVLGTLCVLDRVPRPEGLEADRLAMLRTLSAQVVSQFELRRALAQRDALLAGQRAAMRERDALARVQAAVVAAEGDLDATLAALVENAMAAVPAAEGGVLELISGDVLEYRAVRGTLGPHRGLRVPLRGSLAGHCVATNAPLLMEDSREDPRVMRELVERLGLRSAVLAPVRRGERVLGVLKLQSSRPRAFDARDLQVAELFARAATAGLTEVRAAEAQRAVLAAARRQQAILDSAVDVAIIATDGDGRVTNWNSGAERILGWTAAEMRGRTVDCIFTREDRLEGRMAEEMRLALAHGRASDERWHMRRDGGRFWASGEMMPMRGGADEPAGFVKVLRDRTEQHEAGRRLAASEAELRLQREFLATLLRQAPVGIGISDASTGRFLVLNDKAHALLGHGELGEDLGRYGRYGALHPDGCPFDPEDYPIVRALHAGVAVEREEVIYRQGGAAAGEDAPRRRLEVSSTPVRDAAGAVVAAITVFFDVEEQRQASDMLRDMNALLERRVAAEVSERASTEEQLRQSQKMEAVGQLTGGLAHDFNNLLTGIIGSLELLGGRMARGQIKDADRLLAAARGSADRAAALTHRLLAFSRRQPLDPRPTDVNRLVAGMEELVRRTVGSPVTVEVRAGAQPWPVLVDPPQLENALLNLCINARDAMPEGGRVVIETANLRLDGREARALELPPGEYVSLDVTDTGTGMPPEVVARAFEPFFTTKPLGQGTGLGLSMVYGFVRQSGGRTTIRSEPGRGTAVCLLLPRHEGTAEAPERRPAPPAQVPRAGQGETVLVVDDEPVVRMLIAEVLEELGYAAIEAADGASGLRVLQSDARIDLLVSDVGLPGDMNGRQMADAARRGRPGLRVLFVTGNPEGAVAGRLEAGMDVMGKPFTLEALASRVRALIAAP